MELLCGELLGGGGCRWSRTASQSGDVEGIVSGYWRFRSREKKRITITGGLEGEEPGRRKGGWR